MVFTRAYEPPMHPLKRSQKTRIRKEEEKKKREKAKKLNELKYKGY